MGECKKGNFSAKHPSDRRPDPRVSEAVLRESSDGGLSCAAAFRIAGECGVEPSEVGFVMDFLEIRLLKCQLGLFGYRPENRIVKPADSVSPALEAVIRQSQGSNGKIPCVDSWKIAEKLSVSRMEVSSACEALHIKVSACQLGAF